MITYFQNYPEDVIHKEETRKPETLNIENLGKHYVNKFSMLQISVHKSLAIILNDLFAVYMDSQPNEHYKPKILFNLGDY